MCLSGYPVENLRSTCPNTEEDVKLAGGRELDGAIYFATSCLGNFCANNLTSIPPKRFHTFRENMAY